VICEFDSLSSKVTESDSIAASTSDTAADAIAANNSIPFTLATYKLALQQLLSETYFPVPISNNSWITSEIQNETIKNDDSSDYNICQAIFESLLNCPAEIRIPILHHIHCSGIGFDMLPTLFHALSQQLPQQFTMNTSPTSTSSSSSNPRLQCLQSVIQATIQSSENDILVLPLLNRVFPRYQDLAWIGGSLFAHIDKNQSKYVSQEQISSCSSHMIDNGLLLRQIEIQSRENQEMAGKLSVSQYYQYYYKL
jgi:hypothetical protein